VSYTIPIRGRRGGDGRERFVRNPFILGLDLARVHVFSLLSVLERDPPPWPGCDPRARPVYHLIHLERVQLPYPELAAMVRDRVVRRIAKSLRWD
jgi:hypothetical protein